MFTEHVVYPEVWVDPSIIPADSEAGLPARLQLVVTVRAVHDDRPTHLPATLIGSALFALPPGMNTVVELVWPYIEGSTFDASGSEEDTPPPDSLAHPLGEY